LKRAWTLAGRAFPTSVAVERELRAILDRHADGDRLEGEEDALVRAVLEHHPHYPEVRGCGIAYVYVFAIPDTPWKRFNVCRTDGSIRDVAWSHCLANHPDGAPEGKTWRQLMRICRHYVQDQMMRFRESRYDAHEGWACEVCGDLVLYSHDVHIHHLPPNDFVSLVRGWLELVGRAPAAIAITASSAYQGHSRFRDPLLAESWTEYHATWAAFQVVCVDCHKKLTREQRESHNQSYKELKHGVSDL
jgi:hypothetical protein